MAMEAGEIERLIKETFPDAQVTIEDLRGMEITIAVLSAAFEGEDSHPAASDGVAALQGRMGNELRRLPDRHTD